MKTNKMRSGFTFFELIFVIVFIASVVGVFSLFFVAEPKEINGNTYDTYGYFSKNDVKNDKIQYKRNTWSIVSGIILVETVIVPIYQFGFNLYEPVGVKDKNSSKIKGTI